VPARFLRGAPTGDAIRAALAPRVAAFTARHGRAPALHIILVGADAASEIYVRTKERAGASEGLAVVVHRLAADVPLDAVRGLIQHLNEDVACDGVLVQAPLPPPTTRRDVQELCDALDPGKDVDGFHPHNIGLLVQGRARLPPCTPSGIIELLKHEGIPIAGKHAVVIGRSEIVGKPMALLLLQHDATVTVCHSKTRDLAAMAAEADLLVAAIGQPAFVTPAFVKPGAVVIDVGINRLNSQARVAEVFGPESAKLADFEKKGSVLVGDVHPAVAAVAGAMTPVPGGVGPLTIAMLLKNTLIAAEMRAAGS
jgi:methylenetetrahydrofolate dehydrogenase (NADP+)/methenyltetrahydrofolate cyclohydrolase